MGEVGPVHPPGPESATLTPACERCRSFKKKCSRTLPSCSLCLSAGHPCSYSQPQDPRTHNRQLRARLAWLSRYVDKHAPPGGFAGGKRKIDQVDTGTDLDEPTSVRLPPGPPLNGLNQTGPEAVPSIHHQLSERHNILGPRCPLVEPTLHPLTQATADLTTELVVSDPPSVSSYVPIDRTCSENGSIIESNNNNHTSAGQEELYSLAYTAMKLVDAFFSHVGRSFPCVDYTRVRAKLENEKHPFAIRSNDREWTMLYLVMAIGSNTLQRADQIPKDARPNFNVPYSEALHDCMLKPSLTSVKVLVLLSIYSLTDAEYSSTWTLASIACRQAIDLGLTRRGSRRKTGESNESEERHRLFWSVYVLDRRMATCLGVQPMIIDDNAEIPLPSLTVNEFISSEHNETAFSLQISQQAVQLSQLEDKILRSVHLQRRATCAGMAVEARQITVQRLRLDIENWYSQWCLLTPYSVDNVAVQSSVTWISARYYYLLMLLYYPTYFNLYGGGISNPAELVDFATKYVQSVNILLQQHQAPLDRLTLCRLLQAGLMLIYGYVNVNTTAYPAKDEIAVLIEILGAYDVSWGYAHAAARILRTFHGSLKEPGRNLPRRPWDTGFDQQWKKGINTRQRWADLLDLMQEFLGPSSSFCLGLAEQIQVDALGRPVSTSGGLLDVWQSGNNSDYRDLEFSNGVGRSELDSLRHQEYPFVTPGDP